MTRDNNNLGMRLTTLNRHNVAGPNVKPITANLLFYNMNYQPKTEK